MIEQVRISVHKLIIFLIWQPFTSELQIIYEMLIVCDKTFERRRTASCSIIDLLQFKQILVWSIIVSGG